MISNSESMRRWAVAAGALFILADVAGVASVLVLGLLLDGPGCRAHGRVAVCVKRRKRVPWLRK
jgi:hypothetical protein